MDNARTADRLGDVADMLSGGTPSKSNQRYWNGSIPWLTPKDMGRWSGVTEAKVSPEAIGNGTRLAPRNSIFIAVRGMSLHNEIRVVRAQEALTFNQDIKAIVARKGIDPLYLHYVLISKRSELLDAVEAAGHGTGRLPTDRLKDLLLPRFAPPTEAALAELFGALDRRIELNRQMNETLEAMARAIFKDWFVDFGPTRAKAERRAPYFAPEIWDLFPDALDDDDKPVGWSLVPLIHLCELKRGYDLPKRARNPGHVPIMSSSGASGWHDAAKIKGPGIVTGRYGTIGQVFTCETDFWPLNTTLYVRDFKGHPFWFVFHTLSRLDYAKYSDKAAVPGVNRNALHTEPVALPPADVSHMFEKVVASFMAKVSANERESETLASTRDRLLPKLMSGEIRIARAEKAVEAIA